MMGEKVFQSYCFSNNWISSHQGCSVRKGVLRNFAKFTGKHLCQSLFFKKACNFVKNETLAQVFSCEFCEIFKKTFSYRTPLVIASLGPISRCQVFVLRKI